MTPDHASATLRRTLSLWQVTLSGIGVILGAGVYALIGPAAGQAGNALWLSFLLAGVTAGLTAYAYARLGRLVPKTSPEFQYTALAFGPTVGWVAGSLMLAADLLAAAAVAIGFGGYLEHMAGTPLVGNALALVAVLGTVLYFGVGQSVAIAIVLTVLEAVGLVFVIIIGLPSWSGADYLTMPNGVGGVVGAAALIFFAYLGFDELGNFAEEMHRPERDLPRALFLALTATTVIYVLVALSATAVVDSTQLGASPAPLALVARRVLGDQADTAVSALALAATANTSLLLLVSAARSIYGMAAAGVLPERLARVNRRAVPAAATALVLVLLAGLVSLGDLRQVAALTDAAVLVAFILVNASLLWLAARRPAMGSGKRRASDALISALAILLCGWLLLHAGALSVIAALGLSALALVAAPGTRAWGQSVLRRRVHRS